MKRIAKMLAPLFFVFGMFIFETNINAASLNPDNYVKSVSVTDGNGNQLNGSTPVQSGSIINIDVKWAASSSNPIHSGDSMTIPLSSSNSSVNIDTYTKQGPLVLPDGTNVGQYTIQNGKITMNFDDNIDGLDPNTISGTVSVKAMVTSSGSSGSSTSTNVHVGSQTVTVTATKPTSSGNGVNIVDPSTANIQKNGSKEQTNGKINWVATVTIPKGEQSATITDTIGPGQLFSMDTVRISGPGLDGQMTVKQFEDAGYGTVTQTDSGFKIDFNMTNVNSWIDKHNFSGMGLQIVYSTQSDMTYTGDFTNTINLTVKDSSGKSESHDSTAQSANITSNVTITGQPNTMQFVKRNSVSLTPIQGAVFSIKGTDQGENNVSSFSTTATSDSNGIVKVSGLKPGIYSVQETKAPAGYQIDSNIYYFEVNSDGTTTPLSLDADDPDKDIINILDLPQPSKFTLTKENTDGQALSGAKFGLYNSNGELVQNLISSDGLYETDSQGKTTIDVYADGSYTLKEVKAPAGYELNSKVYNVTLKNGSITTDLGSGNVVVDKKAVSSSSSSIKSSSSSKKSSSSIKSSAKSSSLKSSSSSKKSSSSIKSSIKSSSLKSSSSSKKSSSSIKSSAKSSSIKSSSSKKSSSSIKSSIKSSSLKSSSSSKKSSSSIKSSAKSSSLKSSSSSKKSSSSIKSSTKSSSLKSSSSSKKSSSSIKSSAKSSSIKSSSSSKKSSSSIKSSAKGSSLKSSSSSKKSSSSIKSSAKSSSLKSSSSSKKSSSSSIKSSTKSSSLKSSSSSKKSSSSIKSSAKSSSIKSSSSKKSSSSIKSSAKSSSIKSSSSKKSSSSIKSSAKSSSLKSSSSKKSSSSSIKSSTKSSSIKSSSMNSAITKSHRTDIRSVKSSSSKRDSSSSIKNSVKNSSIKNSSSKNSTVASSSTINNVSESISKPNKDTETSVKVPSKASTSSYVNKSTQVSVPVVVSSKTNTMVESSISSEINNGSSSTSVVNKPTLVSSSMDIPVRSWSNSIKDESSAVVTGTTVSTYSQSKFANRDVNKSTSNTATTQNTAVINNTNSHSTNQGGVAVAGNNNNDNNAQGNKSGKGNNRGEGLPQTGEVAATAVIGLGVVLIAVSGLVILKKKNS